MNRYTLQLSERFIKLLEETAEQEQITKAELIRRSVALYALINREMNKGNRTLKIVDEDTGQEIIFLSSVFSPYVQQTELKEKKTSKPSMKTGTRAMATMAQ